MTYEEQIKRVREFKTALTGVCKAYGFSLSHEDSNGAFKVTKFSRDNAQWLLEAEATWLELAEGEYEWAYRTAKERSR
jgi:hypothetical protein